MQIHSGGEEICPSNQPTNIWSPEIDSVSFLGLTAHWLDVGFISHGAMLEKKKKKIYHRALCSDK